MVQAKEPFENLTGFRPFEYRTPKMSGIQMNPVFGWLLYSQLKLSGHDLGLTCLAPAKSTWVQYTSLGDWLFSPGGGWG